MGGLEHYAKIAPRSIPDAEKWIRWLESWIVEENLATEAPSVVESRETVGPYVAGEPHAGRTVLLPEFGCYAWVEYWKERWCLFACEIGDYQEGGRESEGICDVTAPESQEFLDAVNEHLGTTFQMDEFAGR